MRTYDFEWRDREGDTYQSDMYDNFKDVLKAWNDVRKNDDDATLIQTWIYDENSKYVGPWD